jgi:hypothetical protein
MQPDRWVPNFQTHNASIFRAESSQVHQVTVKKEETLHQSAYERIRYVEIYVLPGKDVMLSGSYQHIRVIYHIYLHELCSLRLYGVTPLIFAAIKTTDFIFIHLGLKYGSCDNQYPTKWIFPANFPILLIYLSTVFFTNLFKKCKKMCIHWRK